MVGAAGQCLDHTLHLQLEKEGGELTHGDVGLDSHDVLLQVVGLLQKGDDGQLLWRQVGKELPLYGGCCWTGIKKKTPAVFCCWAVVGHPTALTKSLAEVMSPALLSRIRLLQPSL